MSDNFEIGILSLLTMVNYAKQQAALLGRRDAADYLEKAASCLYPEVQDKIDDDPELAELIQQEMCAK
ncbi:MAG: hypothetical protein HQ511_09015 [Rhodospirillales bacterium]|nr:hypothetical protein [Rhodospirillales bacterium]